MTGYSTLLLVALTLLLLTIKDIESKKLTLDEARKTIKNLTKSCGKKFDSAKDLMAGTHKGEFPKDEQLMCYMKCILTTSKAMKNDEVQWDVFIKNARLMLLEEYIPRVEHVVEVCKQEVTATDGCEVAWQLGVCTYKTDAELYLAP